MITQCNETLFPNWQKELWQNFEETSGYVRLERGQQVAQLHDRCMMMMMMIMIFLNLVSGLRIF
jgi:hypothetical protein